MKNAGGYSRSEKVRIFRGLFRGLTHVYGSYDPVTGRAFQVKKPVTNQVIQDHLCGRQPYGVYLLVKDRTHALTVDFDSHDRLAPLDFLNRAKHYGLSAYLERSKSKGFHIWIFFQESGVLSSKARSVSYHMIEEIDAPVVEVFPKQDLLTADQPYGNFIQTPLFGALAPHGRTVFLDPATYKPFPDQWSVLESVQRVFESQLDEIIEINSLTHGLSYNVDRFESGNENHNGFALPPCARKMLREGVTQYQRVSCFRLAVHFKRLGLPLSLIHI